MQKSDSSDISAPHLKQNITFPPIMYFFHYTAYGGFCQERRLI
nr:MAG TPA: hypothetical protein [Caudoviricetes sp.]DAU80298.1 MAG TPA: hypothetical protein [Inoviridae sp.]